MTKPEFKKSSFYKQSFNDFEKTVKGYFIFRNARLQGKRLPPGVELLLHHLVRRDNKRSKAR
jgi:hypothetical protein